MPTLPMNQAQAFDRDAARREGPRKSRCDFAGDVFDCGPDGHGKPRMQLQRLDTPEDKEPSFAGDLWAWRHVVARARAGSALHRATLDTVDETERGLIRTTCGAW